MAGLLAAKDVTKPRYRALCRRHRAVPATRSAASECGADPYEFGFVQTTHRSPTKAKIDADAARRRKAATRGRASEDGSKVQHRGRFEQLRQEALAELKEAAAIYEEYGQSPWLGECAP